MWFLYNIKKTSTGQIQDVPFCRLTPDRNYLVHGKVRNDPSFQAHILVGTFTESDATNPRSKPEITLHQTDGKVEVLVSDRSVSKDYYLHDQDIIRLSTADSRQRIRWEDIIIYKDGPADKEYDRLVEYGAEYGFHVVRECSKLVTHVYISESTQTEVSAQLIRGLMQNKYIVSKKWIQLLLKDDKRFSLKACNEAIQPIEWHDFGPLKKTAILSVDSRRKSLFESMEFIVFDKEQLKRLSYLVEAGKGKIIYYDLNSNEGLDMDHQTMFVSPPEDIEENERWSSLRNRFYEKTGNIREIQEIEIGYAIIYCSTNSMCNPVTSLSSLNLASVTESVPMSLDRTMAYDPDGSDEDYDEKVEPAGCSMAAHSVDFGPSTHERNQMDEEDNIKDIEKENRPSCSVPVMDNEVPEEPVQEDEPMAQEEYESMTLPSLMSNLNDFFDDFVGSMTPLPPPNKTTVSSAESSGSSKNAPTTSAAAESSSTVADKTTDRPSSPVESVKPVPPSTKTTATGAKGSGSSNNALTTSGAAETSSPRNITTTVTDKTTARPPSPIAESAAERALSQIVDRAAGRIPSNTTGRSATRSSSPITTPPAVAAPSPPTTTTPPTTTRAASTTSTTFTAPNRPSAPTSSRPLQQSTLTSSLVPQNRKRVLPTTNTPRPEKRKKTALRANDEMDYEDVDPEPPVPMDDGHFDESRPTRIVYAPLVVRHRPPVAQTTTTARSGGVNFKKFKKVKQFQYHNVMDVVYLVCSSQRTREQLNANRSFLQTPGVRVQDTADFDPELFIRTTRIRN